MTAVLLLSAALTFRAGPQTAIVVDVGAADVSIAGSARADIAVEASGATAASENDRVVIRSADAGGPPDRAARARVDLRVPAWITIESIRIVDGALRLEGLTGKVSADVRQGRISATSVSGVLRLETGFGDVVVDRARIVPGGLLRLRAFNGDVTLTLAGQPEHARVLALTFNGRIDSNLPLARKEAFGPKFAEATFGNGEPLISIDSVTGNITINAAPSPRR